MKLDDFSCLFRPFSVSQKLIRRKEQVIGIEISNLVMHIKNRAVITL